MKVFHCDHCRQLVFFENIACVHCGHILAFLPDLRTIASLEPSAVVGEFTSTRSPVGKAYKLCRNYTVTNVCNWGLPADSESDYCVACQLTSLIPDLTLPKAQERWYKLEIAKRRLLYTLQALGLPTQNKTDDPDHGLTFLFMADPSDPTLPRVLTGHDNGEITVNIAEADDAEREQRRVLMREPYRTLLGHVRHEVGHYYWDRLVRDNEKRLEQFRALFGDDQEDYADALERYYHNGPVTNWAERYISAYASVHAWEDWAETWAHYLHMADTLETASQFGLRLRPSGADQVELLAVPNPVDDIPEPFADLLNSWYPLTYAMNCLNRGLGQPDAYPFVLSGPVVEKLRFIHDMLHDEKWATAKPEPKPRGADSGRVIDRALRWLLSGFPSREKTPERPEARPASASKTAVE